MDLSFNTFTADMPHQNIMVTSHERSGTHFLMNSMAKAFGYHAENWIDLDWHKIPINYFASQDIIQLMAQFRGQKLANPFKSHHQADFFAPVIEDVLGTMAVLYIYRNPWDVMQSVCRLLNQYDWREGPKCATPAELMRSEPEGHMMRYQMRQHPSMLHRWQAHVSGWLELAETHEKIVPVAYESLRDDYAATMMKVAERVVGMTPQDSNPPDKVHNVVQPREARIEDSPASDEDQGFMDDVAGDLMKKLSY